MENLISMGGGKWDVNFLITAKIFINFFDVNQMWVNGPCNWAIFLGRRWARFVASKMRGR